MNNILYLLKLEWLKMRQYMPFIILTSMYLLLIPLSILAVKSMPFPPSLGIDTFFMFPNVWQTVAYGGNWFAFFNLGFIAVLSITNEFSWRTLRQNIISGISRENFFFSKLYFMIALCVAATLYYVLWVFISGLYHTETLYASRVYENSDYIFRYFLMCLSFSSIGLLLGTLLRRTGISLFLYLTYSLFIERIIRYVFIRKTLGNDFWGYAPVNATNDLTPFPIPKGVTNLSEGSSVKIFLNPTEAIITTIIFTIIFLYLTYLTLKNKDL